MAHKGTIGNPPRGPGVPLGSSDLEEIAVKPSPGRAWPKIGTPKGFLGLYKSFPSQKIQGNLVGGRSLHKVMFFGPPFWAQKGPRPSKTQIWGCGFQKLGLGSKISKLGNEKPCRIHRSMPQTEPYVASYGPKPFWGGAPNFGGATHSK